MSSFFGVLNRDKKTVRSNTIQAMDEALSYWVPDGSGIWSESFVAFGHRILWNTPESKFEYLPRTTHFKNQTLTITIVARLDNREELAVQLEFGDFVIAEITDSELVLAAYRKWGEACPKYLLGDFVFVIWDKNKEQLFCARDHIGIKTFYYHLTKNLFVFSNDIKGLLAHPEITKKYNDKSLAMFLAGDSGFYDERETMFEEIKKLPAATSMTITADYVSELTYWDIENVRAIHCDKYEDYVEKLRELLFDAVKVRLRTVYPTASHLSGGLDSSSIAVLAARELEKRNLLLYAFNWIETPGAGDSDYFEWGFASQIAKLEKIQQKSIRITPEFLAELYDDVNILQDDISYYWEEYLVRATAEKLKIRTLLSGWGGDELISYDGYAYLSGLFSQGHFIKAIRQISNLQKKSKKKYYWFHTIKRSLRELVYPFFYKKMPGLYQQKSSELEPFEFAQDRFAVFARELSFKETRFRSGAHNEQKALFRGGHILQRIENWASSSFEKKLEYSYPLLDKRIVEFALAVPEDVFAVKDGHQRHFFRSAVLNILPQKIVWAKKTYEVEHGKALEKLWDEGLKIWLQKNKNIQENKNCYLDRPEMIKRIRTYFLNKNNHVKDDLASTNIVASILLSNLKTE